MPRVNRLEDRVRQPPSDTRRTPPGKTRLQPPCVTHPRQRNLARIPRLTRYPRGEPNRTDDPRSTRTTVFEPNRRPATAENPGRVTLTRGTCEWLHPGAWLAHGSACKLIFDFCFPYFPPDSNPNSILYEIGPN